MQVRLLDPQTGRAGERHQQSAVGLARRLPGLLVAAKEIAASVMHGVHGRRRAGIGETFWQFRPFTAGESAGRIDWRRSGRDDRLYVREREWEAAHTVWIWIDRSPSMAFVSTLAMEPKVDRALVLGLALADLLVRGGERVGLLGLTRAIAARSVVDRFAEAMTEEANRAVASFSAELPHGEPLAPRNQAVLLTDGLNPPDDIAATIRTLAGRGAMGHVVMIADPVEETFPFDGHAEFLDVDSPARMRVGQAESLRADYAQRLARHRDAVRGACAARGWSFAIHRTDRPASEALLALRMRLEAGQAGAALPRAEAAAIAAPTANRSDALPRKAI